VRFARLYLRAYGRFTDRVLDLPRSQDGDLHLVFGPNEAGKSTTLAGVTDFLFGFEHRASFDFHHAAQELRVGACLETAAGIVHAMRRRGRKQTLFAYDPYSQLEGEPLPEDMLGSALSGLDRSTYRMLFGLDLDALVAGGEALLAGKGEVGQSLFQAAAGLSALKGLADDLRGTADALFTARASKPVLNAALKEYADQARGLRDTMVRSQHWEAAEARVRAASQADQRAHQAHRDARVRRDHLLRIRSNLPLLAQRNALLVELEALADVPRLPADAAERRTKAEERLRASQAVIETVADELARLAQAREQLSVREDLLAQALNLEGLYRRMDACALAREDLARGVGALETARARVSELLRELAAEAEANDAAALLPPRTLAARIRALVRQHAELTGARNGVATQLAEASAQRSRDQSALAALPPAMDGEALDPALEELVTLPQDERGLRERQCQAQADEAQVRRLVAELGHADAERLAHLALPARSTVAEFQQRIDTLDQRISQNAGDVSKLARDLDDCSIELHRLSAGGEVVTQADVRRARAHRDDTWLQARRAWLAEDAAGNASVRPKAADTALSDAVEHSIQEADRLADYLHADVERATRYEGIAKRIEQMTAARAAFEQQALELAHAKRQLHAEWVALCAALDLSDLSPAALIEWMHKRELFVDAYERLKQQRVELAAIEQIHACRVAWLEAALAACGLPGLGARDGIAAALQRLQRHKTAATRADADRAMLDKRMASGREHIRRLEHALEQAQAQLDRWRDDWVAATAGLRLAADALPEEAETRLEQFEQLRGALEARDACERALRDCEATVGGFERSVAELSAALGEGALDRPAEVIASGWFDALGKARADEQRRQEIAQRLQREQQRQADAVREAQAARIELTALVEAARCDDANGLARAEADSARRSRLEADLARTEDTLRAQNERAIADIVVEAASFDAEGVAMELADLDARLVNLESALRSAQSAEHEARRDFAAMDGSARAAELQGSQAALAAKIQGHARRWARARLASELLRRVVQTYRERHQGPLLARASAIFARITCGGFGSLATDYVDDAQVLLGVRAGGEQVPVAGMSKGTRDQMYLALRLATIEAHLASRGRFPVIVDDLLVQFDDARALATLEVFRELSAQTQVLFFTHHAHLLDLAQRARIVAASTTHRLDAMFSS
jgi:exonuclease SbcC